MSQLPPGYKISPVVIMSNLQYQKYARLAALVIVIYDSGKSNIVSISCSSDKKWAQSSVITMDREVSVYPMVFLLLLLTIAMLKIQYFWVSVPEIRKRHPCSRDFRANLSRTSSYYTFLWAIFVKAFSYYLNTFVWNAQNKYWGITALTIDTWSKQPLPLINGFLPDFLAVAVSRYRSDTM